MNLNVMFMGSSDFSVPALFALNDENYLKAVVTQPDKPTGRGKKIESPVVKAFAEELGLPVYQPRKLIFEEMVKILDQHRVDLIVVAAYGKILPTWLLDNPKFGAINVHASLLPRWRGASPIQMAILQGDKETGVTIMKVDEGLDTGDILSQKVLEITDDDTAASLSAKLADLGGPLLVETIKDYVSGNLSPHKQDPESATMTKLIRKEDGELDFTLPAEELERKIRAYNPWPICFFKWDSEYIRVYEAEISSEKLEPYERGGINKFPVVGTSSNALILRTVQPAGKNRMDGRSFLNGAKNWLEDPE